MISERCYRRDIPPITAEALKVPMVWAYERIRKNKGFCHKENLPSRNIIGRWLHCAAMMAQSVKVTGSLILSSIL
jgi:hypothetical protein